MKRRIIFINNLSVISRHTVEIRKLKHFFLSGISSCNDARVLFIRKANYVKELDLFKLREYIRVTIQKSVIVRHSKIEVKLEFLLLHHL